MLRSSLAFAVLTLTACATSSDPRQPLVYLSLAGSSRCTVDLEDRRFTLPAQADPLLREARRLARRTEGAIVGAGEEALSFACWHASMAIIRRAGFARLGLVTEAPEPPERKQPPDDPPKTREIPTAS